VVGINRGVTELIPRGETRYLQGTSSSSWRRRRTRPVTNPFFSPWERNEAGGDASADRVGWPGRGEHAGLHRGPAELR
jgi:hypothetical protein